MTQSLHQQLDEKLKAEKLAKQNEAGKKRLQELSGVSSKTSSFLNVKEELKGTIKAVSAILDPKYAEQEFGELMTHHDIPITNDLKDLYNHFTDSIDPTKKRMFNRFTELLLMKKHNAYSRQIEKKGKPIVTFQEEKQLELIIKDELKKLRNRVL
jgi:hypothetical protein